MRQWGMWHIQQRAERQTGFWRRNLRERDNMEGLGIDGRIILKWMLKEIGWDIMEWVYLAQQEHVVGRWLMTNRSNCAKTILFAK